MDINVVGVSASSWFKMPLSSQKGLSRHSRSTSSLAYYLRDVIVVRLLGLATDPTAEFPHTAPEGFRR